MAALLPNKLVLLALSLHFDLRELFPVEDPLDRVRSSLDTSLDS